MKFLFLFRYGSSFMDNLNKKTNYKILQELMESFGCDSFREFSLKFKIAELNLFRLKNGLLGKMSLETALKLAQSFNISLNKLVSLFSSEQDLGEMVIPSQSISQDYQNLQQKYASQKQELTQQFQLSTLETLESFLLQFPTFIAAVNKNPDLPAARLLPLLKPIEQLLDNWDITPIAAVGDKIPYNPLEHELMEGTAQTGELVEVRYVGYRQEDNLLYRAKVSPIY